MKERSSGILMHISSLPGKYGIGDFGAEAYRFIDFLKKSKVKYWQVLPLGITGFADSPYQCFSSYGGNPYFIDLDEFIKEGYLDKQLVKEYDLGKDPERVDYGLLYENKYHILRLAYKNSFHKIKDQLKDFHKENKDWLGGLALFMSLKNKFKNLSWQDWPSEYKDCTSPMVRDFQKENKEEIYFWVFTQYYFFKQWKNLKQYANHKGIRIIGDLPLYVSEDSSDIWENPYLFKVDNDLSLTRRAGVPPDYFSPSGQLWGNPIYDWEEMDKESYKWWIDRIKYNLDLFDVLRLDHFRGFSSYWEIDAQADKAIDGQWQKGPGIKLFKKLKEEVDRPNIIVEDLGTYSPDVENLVKSTGFPNMKVLQFAFNPHEESTHLPHRIGENTLAYTGTHDNPTSMTWLKSLSSDEFNYLSKYLKLNNEEGLNWGFIRGAWASNAYLAIAPIQDFLGLEDARMNTPGSPRNNWTWRVNEDDLKEELARKIRSLTELYGR